MEALGLPYWTLSVLGAAAMSAVALWLLWLAPRNPAVWAFGLLLVVRGASGVTATLGEGGFPLPPVLSPLILVLLVVPSLAFASHYPVRRAWAAGLTPGWTVFTACLLVLPLLAWYEPAWYGTVVGSVYHVGPLALIDFASVAFVASVGCWIAGAARRVEGRLRASSVLVAAAFASYGLYSGFVMTAVLVTGNPYLGPDGLGVAATAALAVAAVPGLSILALLVPMVARETDLEARSALRLAVGLLAAALVSGLFVGILILAGAAGVEGVGETLRGLWRFPLALLPAYALARHALFDLDVRIKWTISRGTLAAVFLAVFFVVATVAQEFLSDALGWAFGGIAAGLLLFAIAPLQRVAERVSNAAMPGVGPGAAPASARGKEEAYRAALQMALADGVITRPEERALAKLAHELGIPAPRALELREAAEVDAGAAGPA